MLNIKKFVMLITVILFSLLCVTTATSQTLRSLADQLKARGHEFYIGCAAPANMSSADQNIVKTEFNIVTCENDMKIGTISPNRGSYNYSGGQNMLNFAKSNNMVLHGHCFVWHKYNPGWVDGTQSMMQTYIAAVGGYFKGNIWGWDVVNEAFHRDGSYRINAIGSGGQDGASVYGQRQGSQYIETAFKAAYAADPKAKLIYNEYSIETLDAKFNGMYTMLQDFKNRNVPITGVGFQMHVGSDFTQANAVAFGQKMKKLADIGLESYITELDGGAYDTSSGGLQHQADIYYWIMKECMAQPMCRAVQVWGVRDSQSWRNNPEDPVDKAYAPLIFNDNGEKKPAYYSIQKAMIEALASPTPTATPTPTPTRTPTPTPTGVLGDVNGDGLVNINDALLIAQYSAGKVPSVFISANADYNRDGIININDALKIARKSAGLE